MSRSSAGSIARAEELGVPILLHPAKPMTTEQTKGYELTSTLGNMFENTIAMARIIASGLLDKHPKLKLVCPHLGGTLPYICGRMDHQITVLKRSTQTLQRKPSEYLRDIYMDIVSPLAEAMRFALDFSSADKLLFSSDHPWVAPEAILESPAKLEPAGGHHRQDPWRQCADFVRPVSAWRSVTPASRLLFLCAALGPIQAADVIPLWPGKPPQFLENAPAEIVEERGSIRQRHRALHHPVPAPADKRTGMAIIVCAGGGYGALDWKTHVEYAADVFNPKASPSSA